MIDSPSKLMLGLLTGIMFGFFLQKGRVAKFPVILGQFLLRDWTVVKIMGTAIVVGALGVHLLVDAGLASLHIKPTLLGGVIFGGVLFGVGLILLGYCPGTTIAACGEGHRDAIAGFIGMLAGALIFVVAYGNLEPLINGLGNLGKITLTDVIRSSAWP